MYVDYLVSGSNTIEEVEVIKQKSIELFRKGGFNLHKWHSNIPSLKLMPKKNLKTADLTKTLGVPWNKNCDNHCTKSEVLHQGFLQ